MAGKIIADTLEHSTAGSLTTDYVVNGSAKAHSNFNGTGTVAIRDSLNVSSLTDISTGRYDTNFTNSFNNANYSTLSQGYPDSTWNQIAMLGASSYQTTTETEYWSVGNSGTYNDTSFMNTANFGDLA